MFAMATELCREVLTVTPDGYGLRDRFIAHFGEWELTCDWSNDWYVVDAVMSFLHHECRKASLRSEGRPQ